MNANVAIRKASEKFDRVGIYSNPTHPDYRVSAWTIQYSPSMNKSATTVGEVRFFDELESKWSAEYINFRAERLHLGFYATPEDAIRAILLKV